MSRNKAVASGVGAQAAGRDINNITLKGSFIFNPQDLADLIDAIFDNSEESIASINDFSIVSIDEKNAKNNITAEFYDEFIKEDLGKFKDIDRFLKNPKNKYYKDKFFGIVKILSPKVLDALQKGQSMQTILTNLFDYFFESKQVCKTGKEYLATTLSYYMYHCCYIGRK